MGITQTQRLDGTMTVRQAQAILASVRLNGDSISDFMTIAANLAVSERKAFTFAAVRSICAGLGVTFDANGDVLDDSATGSIVRT